MIVNNSSLRSIWLRALQPGTQNVVGNITNAPFAVSGSYAKRQLMEICWSRQASPIDTSQNLVVKLPCYVVVKCNSYLTDPKCFTGPEYSVTSYIFHVWEIFDTVLVQGFRIKVWSVELLSRIQMRVVSFHWCLLKSLSKKTIWNVKVRFMFSSFLL